MTSCWWVGVQKRERSVGPVLRGGVRLVEAGQWGGLWTWSTGMGLWCWALSCSPHGALPFLYMALCSVNGDDDGILLQGQNGGVSQGEFDCPVTMLSACRRLHVVGNRILLEQISDLFIAGVKTDFTYSRVCKSRRVVLIQSPDLCMLQRVTGRLKYVH